MLYIIIYLIIGVIVAGIEVISDLKWMFKNDEEQYESFSIKFWVYFILCFGELIRFILLAATWPLFTGIMIQHVLSKFWLIW